MPKNKKAEKRRPRIQPKEFEDLIKMREDLKSLMYHKEAPDQKPDKRFICSARLESFWSKHDVRNIEAFGQYEPETIGVIKTEYLQVLAIAIFIGWGDLIRFDAVFVKEGLNDANLFFNENQLVYMEEGKEEFHRDQFLFKPEIIKENGDSHVQVVPAKHRLPFDEKCELIGIGGFGAVTRRQIVPGCLENNVSSNYVHIGPAVVAVKQYQTTKSEDDFTREFKNLRYLKKSIKRAPESIMLHKAAIAHGQNFMILLPLAETYNLEVFLRDGMQPLKSTTDLVPKYNFKKRFPQLDTDADLHKAVVKQAWLLAGGLSWLHDDLAEFENQDRYLAHMDLKPENILICGKPWEPNTSPAGTWKLSDFGISAFNKTSNEPLERGASIRDMTSRVASPPPVEDEVEHGQGPYQPPEIALKRKQKKGHPTHLLTLDYRKCDVWSFGCILSEVLAFALGRSEGVKNFRRVRFQGGDDLFYTCRPSPTEVDAIITAEHPKLKAPILEWRTDILNKYAESWVPGFIDVLFGTTMMPYPKHRAKILDIRESLGSLYPKLNNPSYQGLVPTNTRQGKSKQQPLNPQVTEGLDPDRGGAGVGKQFNPQSSSANSDPLQPNFDHNQGSLGQGSDGTNGTGQANSLKSSLQRRLTEITNPLSVLSLPQPTSKLDPCAPINRERFSLSSKTALPPKPSILAACLEPKGRQIALLCKANAFVFDTIKPNHQHKTLKVSPKLKEPSVRLVGSLFAIFGSGGKTGAIIVSDHSLLKAMRGARLNLYPKPPNPQTVVFS
ncbi:MAG: hypothetical protein Q9163_001702 [Psora crenata]